MADYQIDIEDLGDCTCGNPRDCRCEELEEERAERAAESKADDKIERDWLNE